MTLPPLACMPPWRWFSKGELADDANEGRDVGVHADRAVNRVIIMPV
jgi:hypothetical protein